VLHGGHQKKVLQYAADPKGEGLSKKVHTAAQNKANMQPNSHTKTSKKIVGETPYYMDATTVPDTPEKRLLDYLGLHRSCCRKHFLTQKDLMDKI
jgi:DNA-directed RNA polymerase subunit N (RpoN/RPB10)